MTIYSMENFEQIPRAAPSKLFFLCLRLFEYIGSRTATYIAWSMMMKAKRGSHWCLCSSKGPLITQNLEIYEDFQFQLFQLFQLFQFQLFLPFIFCLLWGGSCFASAVWDAKSAWHWRHRSRRSFAPVEWVNGFEKGTVTFAWALPQDAWSQRLGFINSNGNATECAMPCYAACRYHNISQHITMISDSYRNMDTESNETRRIWASVLLQGLNQPHAEEGARVPLNQEGHVWQYIVRTGSVNPNQIWTNDGILHMQRPGDDPCRAPKPSESEVKKVQEMFSFLSKPWNSVESLDDLDAIVVLSNWYDRISKIRKVLDLADAWLEVPRSTLESRIIKDHQGSSRIIKGYFTGRSGKTAPVLGWVKQMHIRWFANLQIEMDSPNMIYFIPLADAVLQCFAVFCSVYRLGRDPVLWNSWHFYFNFLWCWQWHCFES